MTTRITHRFSKITRLSGALLPEDRMVLSQKEGTVQKTVNVTADEASKYIQNQIKIDGIESIINIGNGIIGKGSTDDPARLDISWLDQTLARKDHFTITRVGNRKTRYLPISRTKLYESSVYNSALNKAPYTGTIETSGELRIIQPATNAYTLSVGDFSTDGTLDSLQIIERKLVPNNLPEGYVVKGILSKSKNSAILILGRLANPTIEEFWYTSLVDGSLAEESFFDFIKIADRTSSVGAMFGNNSVACARTAAGGRMFFIAQPVDTANDGIVIRAFTLGEGGSNTVTELSSWNTSSYAGLFTGQNRIRLSDKFMGTASEKCELVDKTGIAVVNTMNNGASTTRIQCINNPTAENDLYMIVRREHVIQLNGESQAYVADIVVKITANYRTGIGSAIAVSKYLSNKPTLDTDWVYTNKRNTFRTPTLGAFDSEMMTVYTDGSILLVGDTANGTEEGKIYVRKAVDGFTVMDILDIDAAASGSKHSAPMLLDPKPGYVDIGATPKVYIASPINVYMNGTNFTVQPQVLDLTAEYNAATPTVFKDMPYGGGQFAGLSLRIVYIYLQQSGKLIQMIKSTQQILETTANTLLAVVYFQNSYTARILYGQAYSRMGKYRPSYVPMGAAAPVSYNNPAEEPVTYWLQQAMSGDSTPTFWGDSGATTTQLTYATDGRTVYIRSILAGSANGRSFRMTFGDVDLGVKTFTGAPLIWQTTVVNKSTQIIQTPAVITETINNEEVARSYLNVTPYSFKTDVVGTSDGDDVLASVLHNNPCYIRVQGYDLAIGDVMQVWVTNPSGTVSNLGQKTYQGFPIYFPYANTVVGIHQVKTTNVTRGLTPPNITFNVVPAITYYTPGTYTITIPQGRTAEITLIGAGGGGGGSIHNYSSSNYWVSNLGGDGGNSSIAPNTGFGINTTALVAGGGKGGIGANWGNGSSFTNGSAGEGGVVSGTNTAFTTVQSVPGIKPPIGERWSRQVGGVTVAPEVTTTNNGAGGAGAIGVGDEQWSYGGGGGSGSKLVVRFTNPTSGNVTMTLVVGSYGVGWKKTAVTNGNNGDDGISGYGIVEII